MCAVHSDSLKFFAQHKVWLSAVHAMVVLVRKRANVHLLYMPVPKYVLFIALCSHYTNYTFILATHWLKDVKFASRWIWIQFQNGAKLLFIFIFTKQLEIGAGLFFFFFTKGQNTKNTYGRSIKLKISLV